MKRVKRLLAACLALAALLPLGAQELSQQQQDLMQLQKFAQIYRYLTNAYVDEVDTAPVIEGAITGMLERLDPHSAYIPAEEMKSVRESFDGEFSGIGVEFNVLRDTVIVVNTIAGGPAERVGVRPNDRIVRIDTLDAVGMTRADVPKYLRGATGTKVAIDVVRHGTPGRLHFVIVRDRIPLNTVDAAYRVADGVGYIRVNRFGNTTMPEFREAYRKLGRPAGLILDLQGNGGGLLEQAIEMAGFFLPRGAVVVSTEGRTVPSVSYETQSPGEDMKGRLVVLVDETSASASEIVAGGHAGLGPRHRGRSPELRQGPRAAAGRPARRFGRAHHRGPLPYPFGAGHPAPLRAGQAARVLSGPPAALRRPHARFARRRGARVPDPPHGTEGLRRWRHPSRRDRGSRYGRLLELLRRTGPPGCDGRFRERVARPLARLAVAALPCFLRTSPPASRSPTECSTN